MPSDDTENADLDSLIQMVVAYNLSGAPALDKKIRLVLLDTIACAIGSMDDPVVRSVAESLAGLSLGTVRVPGTTLKTGVPEAAFIMTLAACWHEACEGLASAHGRPGLSVIPALTLLGAAKTLPIGHVLTAINLGYEIGGRLGAAYRIKDGIHVDGTWGLAASAAAVAYLLGGDAPQIRTAMNLALCQMPSSLYLPVLEGNTARNTYAAHGASQSVILAQAALAGVTSPDETGAEARRVVLDPERSAPVDWSVNVTFRIEDAYIKMFAAVRHVHYGVTCALDWVAAHSADAVKTIEGLQLTTYDEAITYCGVRQPRTPIQAQFSLSYGIAHALLFGSLGPEAYGPEKLNDTEVQRLESLIEIVTDPTMRARGATLVVTQNQRIETYKVDALVGDPGSPLTEEDVTGKAKAYMTPVIGAEKAEAIIQYVLTTGFSDAFSLPA